MASITSEPNGRKTIQFIHPKDRKRRSLRLGKASLKTARTVRVHVEAIVSSLTQGVALDEATGLWLAERDDVMIEKLSAVGLTQPRASANLGQFIDGYISMCASKKPATIKVWRQTRRYLVDFFGETKPLRDITAGDAIEWQKAMEGRTSQRHRAAPRNLSKSTINKHTEVAKQMLTFALKKRIVRENPFADMACGTPANRSRDRFITRAESDAILAACPDAEWRLIFALSRFGGLRCPSEHLSLRWGDIDWEGNKIRVTSPKTEHHDGKGFRVIPLFPELRKYLDEVWDEAGETGAEFVITRHRPEHTNLRHQFGRIIALAGLQQWPKLFHNLRATRQTELEEEYPSHVVCAWIGNSKQIAEKHYLQTTAAHFEKAVQNPVQQVTTSNHIEPHAARGDSQEVLECKSIGKPASECIVESETHYESANTGFARGKPIGSTDPVQNAVHGGDDVDLMRIIAAWPELSHDVRTKILSLIE